MGGRRKRAFQGASGRGRRTAREGRLTNDSKLSRIQRHPVVTHIAAHVYMNILPGGKLNSSLTAHRQIDLAGIAVVLEGLCQGEDLDGGSFLNVGVNRHRG